MLSKKTLVEFGRILGWVFQRSQWDGSGFLDHKDWTSFLLSCEGLPDATQRAFLAARYQTDLLMILNKYHQTTMPELLAQHLLQNYRGFIGREELIGLLERDGYRVSEEGRLFHAASVDVAEIPQTTELERIYSELFPGDRGDDDPFAAWKLAQEALQSPLTDDTRWHHAIADIRTFLERILFRTMEGRARDLGEQPSRDRAYQVRDALERWGVLSRQEKELVAAVYALLSEEGAHASGSERSAVELARQMAPVLAQFVMMKLRESRG